MPVPTSPPSDPTTGTWRLKQIGLAKLLHNLAMNEKTGTLVLKRGEVSKSIFFKSGYVMFAESNLATDRLGEVLCRRGEITRSQLSECLAEAKKSGKMLGAVLVERGVLRAERLLPAIEIQVREIVLGAFSWDDGDYSFSKDFFGNTEELLDLKIRTADLVLEGVRRTYTAAQASRVIGDLGRPPRLSSQSGYLTQDLTVGFEVSKVLSKVDGTRPVQQIVAETGLAELAVLQILAGLAHLKILDAESTGSYPAIGASPSPSASPPPPSSGGSPAGDVRSRAARVEEMRAHDEVTQLLDRLPPLVSQLSYDVAAATPAVLGQAGPGAAEIGRSFGSGRRILDVLQERNYTLELVRAVASLYGAGALRPVASGPTSAPSAVGWMPAPAAAQSGGGPSAWNLPRPGQPGSIAAPPWGAPAPAPAPASFSPPPPASSWSSGPIPVGGSAAPSPSIAGFPASKEPSPASAGFPATKGPQPPTNGGGWAPPPPSPAASGMGSWGAPTPPPVASAPPPSPWGAPPASAPRPPGPGGWGVPASPPQSGPFGAPSPAPAPAPFAPAPSWSASAPTPSSWGTPTAPSPRPAALPSPPPSNGLAAEMASLELENLEPMEVDRPKAPERRPEPARARERSPEKTVVTGSGASPGHSRRTGLLLGLALLLVAGVGVGGYLGLVPLPVKGLAELLRGSKTPPRPTSSLAAATPSLLVQASAAPILSPSPAMSAGPTTAPSVVAAATPTQVAVATPPTTATPPPVDPVAQARKLVTRGDAAVNTGDGAKAVKLYQQAIALDPKNALAYRGLGGAYMLIPENAKAKKAFQKYLELAPNDSLADQIRQIIPTLQ